MVEIGRNLLHFESMKNGKSYHSYLWKKPGGNILFDHIPHLSFWKSHLGRIGKLGGITWVYLTHAGDADEGTLLFHKEFGTRLAGGEYEGEKARKKCHVPLGKVIDPDIHEKGIACIGAPGHCATFQAIHFGAAKESYLFKSDMFFRDSATNWKVTIPERLARIGLKSIESIFSRSFDYLLPGLSGAGIASPMKMDGRARKELMKILQATLGRKYGIPVGA